VGDDVPEVLKEKNTANTSVRTGNAPRSGNQERRPLDCSVQISGQPRRVTIRVVNDKPDYQVGAPH
jgi:hypothetical protein